MTQTTQTLPPAVTRAGEGEARWWFQCLAEIKLTAAQTGGLLTIIEITEPPGSEAPLHVHHRDDETFWILEGDLTIVVGGRPSTPAPATSSSAPAACRTATPSAPTAAACCSS